MKKILSIFSLLLTLSCLSASAKASQYPLIGAQVFIEPGQTPADIDGFFKTLRDNDMDVARIRMFGAHMMQPGREEPDFTLYDAAFDAAHKYGIRLFATLFPVTDELNDVGGFKFPHSKKHLAQVREYIRTMVSHFGDKPALDTWVLQNEPGTGGTKVARNDLSDSIRSIWAQTRATTGDEPRGYLKADFSDEEFLRYYTAWYLGWIADEVRQLDTTHNLHINPHALLNQLPEYDFKKYEEFLTSLGVSMHQSWHFRDFTRPQYPLGCSLMSDIIREKAGHNPFWVTELQGGNVTASGYVPFCPTSDEITQYLWTNIAAGCQGVIFWTLNARKAVMEAGEWAMLDYQGNPSDRLLAAADVARTIKKNKDLFDGATPVKNNVTLLYNDESLKIQRRNSAGLKDNDNEARKPGAVMRSVIAAYDAIASLGTPPAVASMDYFDWNPAVNPAAVIPNMIALTPAQCDSISQYIYRGGKVIATGLTGFYDQDMSCTMMGRWPLSDTFGASLSEVKVTAPYFDLTIDNIADTIPAHLWRGIIRPATARVIGTYGNDVSAVHNSYGRGQVYWIPSLVNLGAYQRDNTALTTLYATLLQPELQANPIQFATPRDGDGILMRLSETPRKVVAYLINTTATPRTVRLNVTPTLTIGATVSKPWPTNDNTLTPLKDNTITLPPHATRLLTWSKP